MDFFLSNDFSKKGGNLRPIEKNGESGGRNGRCENGETTKKEGAALFLLFAQTP